ncbi:uncharacterized protein [Coffea arabica]|uniref:K Homology domain-containing protein n=1 Tax=Coffea arabica TaxID=13443 RepID=A0A6P6UI02_COFAR|nr:far upstream element-binding protein 2-like [Coffea arabica]
MADEEVMVAAAGSGVQLSDHEKKRKLEDLETDVPEPLSGVDSHAKVDADKDGNAEEDDELADLKRQRVEDNAENDQPAGLAPENGYDKSEQSEGGDADEQPTSVEDNAKLEDGDGQELALEASATVEDLAHGDEQNGNGDQPSVENERPAAGNEEESKKEGEEPSAEGDGSIVQQQSSSDAETSKKIEVPNNKVGVLIGKAGDTIRFLQYNSGAKIQIMRDADADPRAATRPVELIGTLDSINKAEKMINDVIAEADAGGSPSLVARGFSTVQAVVGDQVEIQVPNEKVGLIIGKGGETIKNLQTKSGARIQLVPQHLPAGDQSKERTVRVTGVMKQIEMAREMIKEVMNQTVRPSPLSGGYNQQAIRPRGPVNPQWGNRGPYPGQFMGYDYQQRGSYPSQNPQYPAQPYGNYPPQGPRSSFGHSWEQRPPAAMHGQPPQANYNYGQPQGPEYGQPAPYSQTPAPGYGQGYSEVKYDSQLPAHHSYGGHGVPQSTGYPQGGGTHPGYGPQDQYGRSASYGMPPQAPHGQTYGQPRPNQPGEMPYPASVSTQAYGSNVPPQQSYGYASSGPVQQSYPPYGSGHAADGYNHPAPAAAAGPGYAQPSAQPVSGYGQPGGQQPSAYATGGYGSYPAQPGYTEQPAAANAGYGYQGASDAAYPASGAYGAPSAVQPGYGQPPPTQPGYDQSNPQTSGAYGTTPAPAGYAKSLSPQPGYPQYDSSQMYAAPR